MWVTEASVTLTVVKDSMGVRYFPQEILDGVRRLCASGKNNSKSLPEGRLKNSDWGRGRGLLFLGGWGHRFCTKILVSGRRFRSARNAEITRTPSSRSYCASLS